MKEELICDVCGKENSYSANYCVECGNGLEVEEANYCQHCNTRHYEGQKNCVTCGHRL